MAFHEVPIESLEFNPFKKISKQWMLITAGDEKAKADSITQYLAVSDRRR